jgi:hypothetical protein
MERESGRGLYFTAMVTGWHWSMTLSRYVLETRCWVTSAHIQVFTYDGTRLDLKASLTLEHAVTAIDVVYSKVSDRIGVITKVSSAARELV